MFRTALVSLVAMASLLLMADTVAAQNWPDYPSDQLPGRGPGGYLAWYKLLACWILVVFWIRAAIGSIVTASSLATILRCPRASGTRSWSSLSWSGSCWP